MAISEAVLPPLYRAWMADLLPGPIPEETEATCGDCAMCAAGIVRPDDVGHYFRPETKCCTFLPPLPNFLAGAILSDSDPAWAAGKSSLERRIEARLAVTPMGVLQPRAYTLLYESGGEEVFGRSPTMRCPHYLPEGGRCGIWKHRNSTCATWYCKYVRGARGRAFWETLHRLLAAAEVGLARFCALELDVAREAILLALSPGKGRAALRPEEIEERADPEEYRALWGRWAGREREFYEGCAAKIAPLAWRDVERICGVEVALLLRLTREAHAELVSTQVPGRVKVGPFQVLPLDKDRSRVWAYRRWDPLDLPQALLEVLHEFDGRPTSQVLAAIRRKHGLTIERGLVRKLVDFGILLSSS